MSTTISPDNFDPETGHVVGERAPSDKRFTIMGVLLAVVIAVAIGQGFYSRSLNKKIGELENALQTQITKHDENIESLLAFAKISDQDFERLHQEMTTAQNHLGNTQAELRKARMAADELAKQQKQTAEQFSTQLGQVRQEQATAVGGLSTDITGVKQEITTTKQDLAATRSDLQRAVGDLGVQSGLIATNRQELAELRFRGERDYFEFDLRKVKQPQKFGGNVALQLKKVDMKRQKYTVDLVSDDKRIEKKDKNLNEPVQFYQQGYRQPTEIVVNQILKDRIVGYISVPKARTGTAQAGGAATETATMRSGL